MPDYDETLNRVADAEAQRDDALSENERLRAEVERLRQSLTVSMDDVKTNRGHPGSDV